MYYQALRFWLGVFNNHKVDFFFRIGMEHGTLTESIPIEIAKNNGIQAYAVEHVLLSSKRKKTMVLKSINDSKYISINHITMYQKIDIFDYCYLMPNTNDVKKANNVRKLQKISKRLLDKTKSIKKKIFDNLSKTPITHKCGNLEMRLINVIRRVSSNLRNKRMENNSMSYLHDIKNFYQNIAIDNYNPREKFIFYALHYDPEASTLNRVILSNQLFIIKLISENLPDGWKLLVKEHPEQFRIGFYERYPDHLFGLTHFRTREFYNSIIKNKNTYLVNYNLQSEKLIVDACAIATITGTVIVEGIAKKKPILIFGGNATIFSMVDDTFPIHSISDINEAITKVNNGFTPNYDNIDEIFSNYLYETELTMDGSHSNDFMVFLKRLFISLFSENERS